MAKKAVKKKDEETLRIGDIVRHPAHGTVDLTVADITQKGDHAKIVNKGEKISDIRATDELTILSAAPIDAT